MFTFLSRYWWVFVARGLFAILLGVVAVAWPNQTLTALAPAFGAVALLDGLFAMGSAIRGRSLTPGWWVLLVQGLLGVGVGILTLVIPAGIVICVAAWAIGLGLLHVVAAVRFRHEIPREWWLATGGILGVAFGILFLSYRAEGAVAMLWLIGLYALLWGSLLTMGGIDVHRLSRHGEA